MIAQTHLIFLDSQRKQPVAAEASPVLEPLKVGTRLTEELQFHLLEFAHAENEVAGRYFVSERFADLTYAERNFIARRALNVLEVDEYALRRLGTEIDRVSAVFGNALEGFEHKVEFSYSGKIRISAYGTGNFIVADIFFHLFVTPARNIQTDAFFGVIIFDKVVGAMTGFARFAVHKRVGKASDMAACFPYFGVHQNRAVETYVICAFGDEFFPPGLFDIVLKFHAERTVIPCVCEAAVNFASRENKTAVFAKSDEFVHSKVCHIVSTSINLLFTIL